MKRVMQARVVRLRMPFVLTTILLNSAVPVFLCIEYVLYVVDFLHAKMT